MSLDLYAFVDVLPDRQSWQGGIEREGLELKLDPALDLGRNNGFSPCEINGLASGFELTSARTSEVLQHYPPLAATVGARAHVVCFRWGSDLAECACVLGAALALMQTFGAVAYYPADDIVYDVARLRNELRECLSAL
jgi:hypothetical protein